MSEGIREITESPAVQMFFRTLYIIYDSSALQDDKLPKCLVYTRHAMRLSVGHVHDAALCKFCNQTPLGRQGALSPMG